MALDPILWALKDAPVADALERLALVTIAEHADEDGCGAYPSQGTVAKRCMSSRDAIKDRFDSLAERGLIRLGDQSRAAHIAPEYRPVVWDVAIPLSWWKNLDRVQEYRTSRGLPPLTVDDRPDLPPPPPKKRRSDLGKKRPKQPPTDPPGDTSPQGDESGGGGGYKPGGVGDSSPPTHPGLPPQLPAQGLPADGVHASPRPVGGDADDDAEATLPGMPPLPHRPTASPKRPDPVIQRATAICSVWWNALPRKPLGRETFRNVVLIVAEAIRAGDWTEDQLAAGLKACGPAVTVPALNLQLGRLGSSMNGQPRSSPSSWESGINLARRLYEEEQAEEAAARAAAAGGVR